MPSESVLEMIGISKSFPGVKALDNVNLKLNRGEIHGLMGENGAGKSTLMKVLGGVHQPSCGRMLLGGQPYQPASPLAAREAGIAFVHQELKLVPNMTVAENICLGRLPTRGFGLVDHKRLYEQSQAALDELGVDIDCRTLVKHLNVAKQQMVELAKAVSLDSKILIMDEPTASLSARETRQLFDKIKGLAERGTAIVYISHRMEEIFELCQRVTVLRDGQSVGSWTLDELDEKSLVRHMVGRELGEQFPERSVEVGPEVLRVEGLTRNGNFSQVSFTVKQGEILGMGGLVGAGRTEIARAVAGIDSYHSGSIRLAGSELHLKGVRDGIDAGIGYITEDRKGEGLTLGLSIEENVTLASLAKISKVSLISRQKSRGLTQEWIDRLRVRTPSAKQLAKNLSGGNQQKVVIAKWLARQCKLLIFDEPTRGVDVGARAEIYSIIHELAEQGVGVLVISSDLPELLGLSDRILVLHEGKVAGEFSKEEASPESVIGCAFTGVKA